MLIAVENADVGVLAAENGHRKCAAHQPGGAGAANVLLIVLQLTLSSRMPGAPQATQALGRAPSLSTADSNCEGSSMSPVHRFHAIAGWRVFAGSASQRAMPLFKIAGVSVKCVIQYRRLANIYLLSKDPHE